MERNVSPYEDKRIIVYLSDGRRLALQEEDAELIARKLRITENYKHFLEYSQIKDTDKPKLTASIIANICENIYSWTDEKGKHTAYNIDWGDVSLSAARKHAYEIWYVKLNGDVSNLSRLGRWAGNSLGSLFENNEEID